MPPISEVLPGGFAVPAGGTLELQPGGNHVMLRGLPKTVASLPFELQFREAAKVRAEVDLAPAEGET